jgi:hypothetical protein
MSVTRQARWLVQGSVRTEAQLAQHDAALAQARDEIARLTQVVEEQGRTIAELSADVRALRGHLRTVTDDLAARVAALDARR